MPSESPPGCEFETEKLIMRIDITIPGDVKAIDPVVERIMEAVREMRCAEGTEPHIELVLHEALANAVVHGCQEDPGKKVQISVGCDEDRGMIIVVRDPGGGFQPKELPSPVGGERLFSTHGRGIYLINQLMDEVHFQRGGTEIWMRKS
jgi:serine/threonine-protein kinase RsbW